MEDSNTGLCWSCEAREMQESKRVRKMGGNRVQEEGRRGESAARRYKSKSE